MYTKVESSFDYLDYGIINKFDECFDWVVGKEGGFVYNIDGNNLFTLFGITQKYNPEWDGWSIVIDIVNNHPNDFEERINKDHYLKKLAKERYKEKYWNILWEELPLRFCLVFFDMKVQHGSRLDKEVQKLIKRKIPLEIANLENIRNKKFVDSSYGSLTQKYLNIVLSEFSELEFIFQLLLERLDVFVDWAEYKNKKHLYFGVTKHRVRDLYMEILKPKYNQI